MIPSWPSLVNLKGLNLGVSNPVVLRVLPGSGNFLLCSFSFFPLASG